MEKAYEIVFQEFLLKEMNECFLPTTTIAICWRVCPPGIAFIWNSYGIHFSPQISTFSKAVKENIETKKIKCGSDDILTKS